MFKNFVFLVLLTMCCTSCSSKAVIVDPLLHVLASDHLKIKQVMDSVARYEVQIRYTQIARIGDSLVFTDYDFQVDSENYFYPASTVKLPIAVLALEELNQIDSLDRNTRFYVEGDTIETTFAQTISEIFAVSDNDANNRLVEFLGQDAINKSLADKKVGPIRIAHRLGYHSDDVKTKPLVIYLNDSTTTLFNGTVNTSPKPLKLEGLLKGSGFYDGDSLIREPFDFSLKNYYPIDTQHGVLKRIIFPEQFPLDQRFNISKDQRDFLLNAMHTSPKELGYDPSEYYDGYGKFFMFGDSEKDIPNTIKIYNKVGYAYGTLTDYAYITDSENNIQFMLTATILVNKNGIFNDNTYEYDNIGIPFLAELGRQLYSYELNRKK